MQLLVAGRQCQAIPAPRWNAEKDYPLTVCQRAYLPRTDWPDFLIYVAKTEGGSKPFEFYVVPRDKLSRDTGGALDGWLSSYRGAWSLLGKPSESSERPFSILSAPVQAVLAAAHRANVSAHPIHLKKGRPWPQFKQLSVMVAERVCGVIEATWLLSGEYVRVKVPQSAKKSEGHTLLVIREGPDDDRVFVIPNRRLQKDTSLSPDNEIFKAYEERWDLLEGGIDPLDAMPGCSGLRIGERPKRRKPAKSISAGMQYIKMELTRLGIPFQEVAETRRGVALNAKGLIVNGRRCQILSTRLRKLSRNASFIGVNPPRSDWPEFVLLIVEGNPNVFVMPRSEMSKHTFLSPKSVRLRQFENAWHVLSSDADAAVVPRVEIT